MTDHEQKGAQGREASSIQASRYVRTTSLRSPFQRKLGTWDGRHRIGRRTEPNRTERSVSPATPVPHRKAKTLSSSNTTVEGISLARILSKIDAGAVSFFPACRMLSHLQKTFECDPHQRQRQRQRRFVSYMSTSLGGGSCTWAAPSTGCRSASSDLFRPLHFSPKCSKRQSTLGAV